MTLTLIPFENSSFASARFICSNAPFVATYSRLTAGTPENIVAIVESKQIAEPLGMWGTRALTRNKTLLTFTSKMRVYVSLVTSAMVLNGASAALATMACGMPSLRTYAASFSISRTESAAVSTWCAYSTINHQHKVDVKTKTCAYKGRSGTMFSGDLVDDCHGGGLVGGVGEHDAEAIVCQAFGCSTTDAFGPSSHLRFCQEESFREVSRYKGSDGLLTTAILRDAFSDAIIVG
jgi:hypothetical protein